MRAKRSHRALVRLASRADSLFNAQASKKASSDILIEPSVLRGGKAKRGDRRVLNRNQK